MIFRVNESAASSHGNIQTRIVGYNCWDCIAEVSCNIITNDIFILCRKDIIKRNDDLIFIPIATQFIQKLLTCERDIIANFGDNITYVNTSLELFISNERWQELINKTGLMLAQKWLEQEGVSVK